MQWAIVCERRHNTDGQVHKTHKFRVSVPVQTLAVWSWIKTYQVNYREVKLSCLVLNIISLKTLRYRHPLKREKIKTELSEGTRGIYAD